MNDRDGLNPSRSLAQFIALAEDRRNTKGERHGQAYFNTLYFGGFDPEFADEIRSGPLDPFYDDGRIGPMLDALRKRWDQ